MNKFFIFHWNMLKDGRDRAAKKKPGTVNKMATTPVTGMGKSDFQRLCLRSLFSRGCTRQWRIYGTVLNLIAFSAFISHLWDCYFQCAPYFPKWTLDSQKTWELSFVHLQCWLYSFRLCTWRQSLPATKYILNTHWIFFNRWTAVRIPEAGANFQTAKCVRDEDIFKMLRKNNFPLHQKWPDPPN